MTFSEAIEAMKQGYKVRHSMWSAKYYYYHIHNGVIVDSDYEEIVDIDTGDILSDHWEIYTEPKPEPQFEIGELVMMRDDESQKWLPLHFARRDANRYFYPISGGFFKQCAKFDKDIVFTNKPAKR